MKQRRQKNKRHRGKCHTATIKTTARIYKNGILLAPARILIKGEYRIENVRLWRNADIGNSR